jgi:hypothetical protein
MAKAATKSAKALKMSIPSSKVEIALAPGSVEPAMKEAEAKSTKLYKVPVEKIKTIPGFNVRVQSADYLAHRDMIAASIKANGFDQTKPLSGYVAKEDGHNVIYVTDGHTRLDAVSMLNEGDSDIATLPVLVHPADKSLTDLTVALHTSNTGRPLTPFELGVVVKRLLKDVDSKGTAKAKAEIAGRLAMTPRYLDDVLLLVNGPKEVRTAVLDGLVSSTLAIQELRRDPEEAADRITKAVEKTKPGKKVTKKAIGTKMMKVKATVSVAAGLDMKEIVKAVAAIVRKAVPASSDDEDIKLALVDGTIKIEIEVPDDKPAPKAKAAPAKKAKTAKPEPEKAAPKKTGKAAKAAPAKKGKKAKVSDDDLGIDGAEEVTSEGIDDEVVQLPPAVKNGADVPDDEEVDI